MLAPHIKKKVDKLWERFWGAGITNPLVAVEQITYLLFLKRLEDISNSKTGRWLEVIYKQTKEDKKEGFDPAQCKWKYIKLQKNDTGHMIGVVFPWLRSIEQRIEDQRKKKADIPVDELTTVGNRMADAYFQLDPNKGAILGEAIDLIDDLFDRAGDGSAAQDVMGDTFEYLLGEIATAGKNGQFRTPRHIIRFMVELLDPKPGMRIIDPAAGTGGFLFSAQQYMMRNLTSPETLRIEWDGTPHRAYADMATPEEDAAVHNGSLFVGLDNDRTMTRIGWMNLILHGLENPQIVQGDSLSKREGKKDNAQLLASETYDIVLANPPFTGTVDVSDLEPDSKLFPRAATKGKKASEAITNKSELLFVWLMLDLLKVGGRCAVIVPEGVLFGNTEAHVRLRRELLTEHVVEAVISLPIGVFQPYTNVKSSILVFRKETKKEDKGWWKQGERPRTENVWFYDIEADGFSLNANRTRQTDKDNDLWDVLAKLRARDNGEAYGVKDYFRPKYWDERWRIANAELQSRYPENPEVQAQQGKTVAIHELFPELPPQPNFAISEVKASVENALRAAAQDALYDSAKAALKAIASATKTASRMDIVEQRASLAEKPLRKGRDEFLKICRQQRNCFDKEDSVGWPIFEAAFKDTAEAAVNEYSVELMDTGKIARKAPSKDFDSDKGLQAIALECAKLESFEVHLRDLHCRHYVEYLKAAKHWTVSVRDYARDDEWENKEGKLIGSHDSSGNVLPEYVQATPLYNDSGELNEDVIDPDCIEAHEWKLSSGQYKPFDFSQLRSEKSVLELIDEMRRTEKHILGGLDRLQALVEGRE